MVVGRPGRAILGSPTYSQVIRSIDWNRALIEAEGAHLLHDQQPDKLVCGACLKMVLLSEDDWHLDDRGQL
jgi:hypothetical protein